MELWKSESPDRPQPVKGVVALLLVNDCSNSNGLSQKSQLSAFSDYSFTLEDHSEVQITENPPPDFLWRAKGPLTPAWNTLTNPTSHKEMKVILRAMPIGTGPFRRYVIQNMYNNTVWNGHEFVDDWDQAVVYATPSDACGEIQEILREQYGRLPRYRYLCPVEIEVYGAAPKRRLARYLHQASTLNIKTHEFGNGPRECLVLPVIHWGLMKKIEDEPLLKEVPIEDWWESDDDGK